MGWRGDCDSPFPLPPPLVKGGFGRELNRTGLGGFRKRLKIPLNPPLQRGTSRRALWRTSHDSLNTKNNSNWVRICWCSCVPLAGWSSWNGVVNIVFTHWKPWSTFFEGVGLFTCRLKLQKILKIVSFPSSVENRMGPGVSRKTSPRRWLGGGNPEQNRELNTRASQGWPEKETRRGGWPIKNGQTSLRPLHLTFNHYFQNV